ncbi:MAG: hypothetical protein CVV12_10985 [Gammaproteobacteria bacterium HGW-Gammaproteobacteria-2]|jgi:predicted alpha/beta hydrolase|nr:MAG: hypothetical protein CVV12_10985 [Gammaproteobacteria bacterium HGW-Gammaproteobacteria-2]
MATAESWCERSRELVADDGARWLLSVFAPARPRAALLWIPALGVAARSYRRFAEALAAQGVAVALHEWRGIGSSSVRASRDCDWDYAPLLRDDLPRSRAALRDIAPQVPLLLGGHSLGGQFAALSAALDPSDVHGLVLIAAGLPHPPHFPQPMRAAMALAFVLLPAITRVLGFLPGRQLGFAGRESRGVIRDWVRSGRHGNYRMPGLPDDIEQRLAALQLPVFAMHFAADRFGPEQALYALLDKLGTACTSEVHGLDSAQLGVHANHFAWMQQPEAVARRLGRWARAESQPD